MSVFRTLREPHGLAEPALRFSTGEEKAYQNLALAATVARIAAHGASSFRARGGLRTYVDSGVQLDARLLRVLMGAFHTRSLCTMVRYHLARRVAAASCLLPLTTKPILSGKLGSRHRAAIGLSEETDALVVVVSEERGVISIARDGEIQPLEAKELRDVLMRELSPASPLPVRAAVARA